MFIRTRPNREVQDLRHCIYSTGIPCECGETSRPLGIWIGEYRSNLKQALMEKSRLDKHAHEEGHHIQWKEVKVVQTETNNMCRKYKEIAHMVCITNPISQPSLETSTIWI
jgi:hypothetical protein